MHVVLMADQCGSLLYDVDHTRGDFLNFRRMFTVVCGKYVDLNDLQAMSYLPILDPFTLHVC